MSTANQDRREIDEVPVDLPIQRDSIFDPATGLASLRDTRRLTRLRFADGHLGWLATSYELARELLADARFSMRPPRLAVGRSLVDLEATDVGREVREDWIAAVSAINDAAVIAIDPPDHTRLRQLQTRYFTLRRVAERQERIEAIVDERLNAMEDHGPPTDLVSSYAFPLASLALCDLLGVPPDERHRFERPHETLADTSAPFPDRAAALVEFSGFVRELIDRKRRGSDDDMLGELTRAGELTETELIGVASQLISAGHHTTANMLSLSVLFLLSDESRWEAFTRNTTPIEDTVEELLRYLNLVQTGAFSRTALEPVEIGGVVIERGQSVWVSLAGANRDPAKFPDPDEFEPTRDASGHLAFGHGRHMCLGQHLARTELRCGLAGLVRRFPQLTLALSTDQVEMSDGHHQLSGVRELPVSW